MVVAVDLTARGNLLDYLDQAEDRLNRLRNGATIPVNAGASPLGGAGAVGGLRTPGVPAVGGGRATAGLAGLGAGFASSGFGAFASVAAPLAAVLAPIAIIANTLGTSYFQRVGTLRQLSGVYTGIESSTGGAARNFERLSNLSTSTLNAFGNLDQGIGALLLGLPADEQDFVNTYSRVLDALTDLEREEAINILTRAAAGEISRPDRLALASALELSPERFDEIYGDNIDTFALYLRNRLTDVGGIAEGIAGVEVAWDNLVRVITESGLGDTFLDIGRALLLGVAGAIQVIGDVIVPALDLDGDGMVGILELLSAGFTPTGIYSGIRAAIEAFQIIQDPTYFDNLVEQIYGDTDDQEEDTDVIPPQDDPIADGFPIDSTPAIPPSTDGGFQQFLEATRNIVSTPVVNVNNFIGNEPIDSRFRVSVDNALRGA